MRPVLVMPIHDPAGILLSRLLGIVPELKMLFARGIVSVSTATEHGQPDYVRSLRTDRYFDTISTGDEIGEQFLKLYSQAAITSQAEDLLHLCFADRLILALSDDYKEIFAADIRESVEEATPLLYQRSCTAWDTHPRNYHDLEQMVTRAGKMLFGKSLDFAWCHLALEAHKLAFIMQNVRKRDLSMFAEFILILRDEIQTKDVDWLAWEDPFVLDVNSEWLRKQREQSTSETLKRLNYVVPMLRLMSDVAGENTLRNQ